MKIDLWFATPVYSHIANEQEMAEISQEIFSILEQEKQEILTRTDAKQRSYIQSREIAHRQVIKKYQLTATERFIHEQARLFLSKLCPSAKAIDIRESWLNFYQPGDSQEIHNHVHAVHPSFISGSLYIEAPKDSGDIKFYHPNFNTAVVTTEQGLETFEASYTPEPYKIVLFRSHVPHSVTTNNSNKERISLSFNIYIVE